MLELPEPRGELTEVLLGELTRSVHPLLVPEVAACDDPLGDDDLQLALYLCYELHYHGLPGVADEWEWEPTLLAQRRKLEACFEAALQARVPVPPAPAAPEEMDLALRAVAEADEAPSLSRHIERHATLEQVLEFVIHRSAYQLKEADPHSWVLPRLHGPPKAALVQIQADEYGNGRAERVHAQLFADAMEELGLDSRYGAYVDRLPGLTLATVNLMSYFGLHRRWRGAALGHLAAVEMTSSEPSRRYSAGLRRLGFDQRTTVFYDEHVEADAVHEQIASVDMCGSLVAEEPALTADVLFGARCALAVDGLTAVHLLGAWEAGGSALRGERARAA